MLFRNPLPDKEHQISSRLLYSLKKKETISGLPSRSSVRCEIGLGSPTTPVKYCRVMCKIRPEQFVYTLILQHNSKCTSYLLPFLTMLIRVHLSLALPFFLLPLQLMDAITCNWALNYHATHISVAKNAVSSENNLHN